MGGRKGFSGRRKGAYVVVDVGERDRVMRRVLTAAKGDGGRRNEERG